VEKRAWPRKDANVAEADELRVRLCRTCARLALCSTTPSTGAFIGTVRSGRPGSVAPNGQSSPAEYYAAEAEGVGDDVIALRTLLRHADHELAHILRRPLAEMKTETLEELEARIVDRGEDFEPMQVAVAMHTSEAIVRRARMKAGRDAERGRRLPDAVVNGAPLRFGLGLVEAGYPLRVAAELSGIAKSTLHAHVARATGATWPQT
jgi:hypothetical protein